MREDDIRELAQHAQVDPDSLTEDQIRELAVVTLEDLGYTLKPEIGNLN